MMEAKKQRDQLHENSETHAHKAQDPGSQLDNSMSHHRSIIESTLDKYSQDKTPKNVKGKSLLETSKHTAQTLQEEIHLTRDQQHREVLNYLLGLDFSKHINLMELIKYENFELTKEEDNSMVQNEEILKVIKMLMYRIGIQDERHNMELKELKARSDIKLNEALAVSKKLVDEMKDHTNQVTFEAMNSIQQVPEVRS